MQMQERVNAQSTNLKVQEVQDVTSEERKERETHWSQLSGK